MQPPPKKTGFYGCTAPLDEESDYDDVGVGGLGGAKSSRYKKSITINPTEGFQYSDIYVVSFIYLKVMFNYGY